MRSGWGVDGLGGGRYWFLNAQRALRRGLELTVLSLIGKRSCRHRGAANKVQSAWKRARLSLIFNQCKCDLLRQIDIQLDLLDTGKV